MNYDNYIHKQKYGDDGWSEPGKNFVDVLLGAIKSVNFNEEVWQAVWEEFWGEERKVYFSKREEGSHRKKAVVEEMNVGELWDDDAMLAMDDDEGDDSKSDNFKVTKINMV